MSEARPEPPAPPDAVILQSCNEACAAFRPYLADRWSDYGVCLNPRARLCGYPVRIGRECPSYLPPGGAVAVNPAS